MSRLRDVTLLRVFAVITLVIWHSYCPYTCWDTAYSPINGLYYRLLTNLIPDANMPLFTFLAGYLFFYLHELKGKYKEFNAFLKNKANRLLIPYIIIGTLMNLTMYGKEPIDILYGIPNHLWFSLMLFYVYCVFWVIHNKCHYAVNLILALISFAVVLYKGAFPLDEKMIGGFFYPLYYYVYFYLGFVLFKYKSILTKHRVFAFAISAVVYILTIILGGIHLDVFKSISYIILLILLSNYLLIILKIDFTGRVWKMIERISIYSFGIYVFHQYFLWNLTRIPLCVNFLRPIMESYFVIFPVLSFIAIFALSYILTHYSLKTKFGRYLLM